MRPIFAQPDATAVSEQFERVTNMLQAQLPEVAVALCDAREDLLAFPAFPLSTGASCGRRIP